MKVIEIQFDGHARMPGSQRGTNVLRTSSENKFGESVLVDSLEETSAGVLATKVVEKDSKLVTHRKLYPWISITEVTYEPDVLESKPAKAEAKK